MGEISTQNMPEKLKEAISSNLPEGSVAVLTVFDSKGITFLCSDSPDLESSYDTSGITPQLEISVDYKLLCVKFGTDTDCYNYVVMSSGGDPKCVKVGSKGAKCSRDGNCLALKTKCA